MKNRTYAAFTMAILALGALSSAWTSDQARADTYRKGTWYRSTAVIAAGTPINVRLDSKISTDDASSGDSWSGTVVNDVVVDGRVVIPAGSQVTGVVTSAAQGTHSSRPYVSLAVRQVTVNGRTRSMTANTEPIVAGTNRAKKIGVIAGGAAAGALLGHTVAKDKHGTLIGGLLGGAAGYGLSRHALRTMQLKPGTVVTFTTNDEVAMRL